MENLQLSYPTYYLVFVVIAALVYAMSLYFRDRHLKETKSWLPSLLGFLRFMAILGILFLLLMPLLKRFLSESQKPLLVFLNDTSASIKSSTDAATLQLLDENLGALNSRLSAEYEIIDLPFGEQLGSNATDSINDQSTNLSLPLEYIAESYEDQNLGAIIMVTDGIFNEGKNPLYADLRVPVPIYTVPLGDTTIRTDILIKNVLHNRIVYLNDKFLIETDVEALNAKGTKNKVTLYKVVDGKQVKIESKSFTIDDDRFFKSFQFELNATTVGNVKYVVAVDRLNSEVSRANNSRNIYVEVLDARQKILVLAEATHPDLKALKRTIKANKNYELDIKLISDGTFAINAYDLVILHNLPSRKNKALSTLESINKSRTPVLYMVGAQTDTKVLNQYQEVITIQGGTNSVNDITPILQSDFDLFTMEDGMASELNRYVPVKVPFGEYKAQSTAKVLLRQRIGTVKTDYPLLAFSDIKNHKQAVFAGEGLWRWRLFEYQEFESYKNSELIIQKTLSYLSQKKDKRQFRAFVSKNAFKENESINFDAQLYNENYEAINTPEASLKISNSKGDKFDYTFSKSNGYYYVDAGKFPEGNYNFTAKTNYNGKDLSASGKFSVQSIQKEAHDLTARHGLLHDLSKKYSGLTFYPDQLDQLEAALTSNEKIKPIIYQKQETSPVLDFWWLLALLIAFLVIEWFLRRYFGAY